MTFIAIKVITETQCLYHRPTASVSLQNRKLRGDRVNQETRDICSTSLLVKLLPCRWGAGV